MRRTKIRKKDRPAVAKCLREAAAIVAKAELCTDGGHGWKRPDYGLKLEQWDPFSYRDKEGFNDPDVVCTMGAILYVDKGCNCDAAVALCEALGIDYRVPLEDRRDESTGQFTSSPLPHLHPAEHAIHDWNDDKRRTKRQVVYWLKRAALRMEKMV